MTGRPSGTKRRRRPSTPAITSTSLIGSPSSQGAAGRQAAKHPDPGVVIAQSLERLVSGNCYQTQRPSVVVRGQGQDPHVRHVERERRQELVHQVTAIVPGVIRETSLTCVFLRRTSPASTYPVGELRPASKRVDHVRGSAFLAVAGADPDYPGDLVGGCVDWTGASTATPRTTRTRASPRRSARRLPRSVAGGRSPCRSVRRRRDGHRRRHLGTSAGSCTDTRRAPPTAPVPRKALARGSGGRLGAA